MNLDFKPLLPAQFSPNSRVWVYQGSRLVSLSEAIEIENEINNFCKGWSSHGAEVAGYGNLFFGQFLVLIADESKTTVGGCSTDSSVRFVKQVGEKYGVDFFNRTNLAFFIKDKIQVIPMTQVAYAIENGFINADTVYFNNLVETKEQLENKWLIPVKDSWLASKFNLVNT
jgi:hypothetical protein